MPSLAPGCVVWGDVFVRYIDQFPEDGRFSLKIFEGTAVLELLEGKNAGFVLPAQSQFEYVSGPGGERKHTAVKR